ncbi:MAG: inner membrane-spanning protein YciB [Alphaproteobacteria bacterium]
MSASPPPAWIKPLLEYAPLIGFFGLYQFYGLQIATLFLVIATLIAAALLFAVTRKISWVPLIAALLVAIFGAMTLWFNDPIYIMMKPTLVNLLFVAVLGAGLLLNKLWLKSLLGTSLLLPDPVWRVLTRRYMGLFLVLAALNEWAWRVMGESFWVSFKLFGLVGLTLAFSLAQSRLILHHQGKIDNQ